MIPGFVPSAATKPTAGRIVDKRPSDTVVCLAEACPSSLVHNCPQPGPIPVNKPQSFFHLHLISDATGETLLAAGRAASAQYKDARAIEHIYPLIRTEKQVAKVFDDIEEEPGIILYTVVDQKLARSIDERCAAMGLPCVSVLEPVLTVFQSYLGTPAGRRVGAQHVLDAEYFRRIDALNFTMEHDDGQLPANMDDADVVLIGISRTSKTPTSIYLANRGIKTANIPIVLGVPLPESLIVAKTPLVVGLVATAERISHVRQNRILGNSAAFVPTDYVDRAAINEELAYARQLCTRHGWPMIDVSRRSIEETAAAIVALRGKTR
ncbi:pyruvate, water dikinase regulatory protein [Mesorhizobium sp. CA8]|uniref:pyruvate, water dikinase regulatory protein n=1 Tax=Mesorhizobium sp. CA8 TaxID=2876637 RepID=UPI0021E2012C